MKILINGKPHEMPEGSTARDAALEIGIEPGVRGVAVAVDGEVVTAAALMRAELKEGQRVEVVAAIQGGM